MAGKVIKFTDPFYGSQEWKQARAVAIGRLYHAGCALCGHPFDRIKGIHVDHIIPRKKAPWLALSQGNLRLMHHGCHSTHTHKHKTINKKYKPVNTQGFPDDWA